MDQPGLESTHLAILGIGRRDPALDTALAGSAASDRIHLLPAVPPDELLEWVSGADVDVLPIQPSTLNHRLSTPNKLFESLAAGVPVVASDFPAMRAVVADDPDGPLGELVDPTDPAAIARAIRSILERSPAERADLRARCLRAAHTRWNWETESVGLLDLYGSLETARQPAGEPTG
jgi:glycosyltransferase involved in cell wall biosynthesis